MGTAGSGEERPRVLGSDQAEPHIPSQRLGGRRVGAPTTSGPLVQYLRLPFASFLRVLLFEEQQERMRGS